MVMARRTPRTRRTKCPSSCWDWVPRKSARCAKTRPSELSLPLCSNCVGCRSPPPGTAPPHWLVLPRQCLCAASSLSVSAGGPGYAAQGPPYLQDHPRRLRHPPRQGRCATAASCGLRSWLPCAEAQRDGGGGGAQGRGAAHGRVDARQGWRCGVVSCAACAVACVTSSDCSFWRSPVEASGERCGYPKGEAGTTEFGHVLFDAGRMVSARAAQRPRPALPHCSALRRSTPM